jgi:hypothetical protein
MLPQPPDAASTPEVRRGEAGGSEPTWAPAPVADDDDLDLLAEVNHRPSRTTVLLVAGILAAVAFVGGAVVQKHYGTTSNGGQAGAAAGGFAARTRTGTGGYGSFSGFPGGAAGAPGGAAAAPGGAGTGAGGTAAGGTSGAATAVPVVVGTVTKLSGSSLTVKNLGGKSVKVTVPSGATITLVAGKSLTMLKTGATVSVAGTTAADGTVTATSITIRS